MSLSRLVTYFTRCIRPRSQDEDVARREFILNVFIAGVLALLFAGICIDSVHYFVAHPDAYRQNSLPSVALYGCVAVLITLYVFSRKGQVLAAAYILVGALFMLTAYMGYAWGIDVPAQIVLYPLGIVMAGVLISTRIAFLATLLIVFTMIGTGLLHRAGFIYPNQYWKTHAWTWTDIAMITIIYMIVAVAAWLSNREIEKSLARARRSEKELIEERDLLEERVRERTDEVRRLQMERMAETYRLVEFGRFASGIFHDLISPLTALSLTVTHINESKQDSIHTEDVSRARRAIAHMHERLEAMRTHLSSQGSRITFSIAETIQGVIEVLTPYARQRNVRIRFDIKEDVSIIGDSVAYTQVMTNLISNAIQSYGIGEIGTREVRIALSCAEHEAVVSVTDTGAGIAPDALTKIFEPFFTTKPSSEGLGIGLSLAKRILEKEFNGTIIVHSVLGQGSVFIVHLPIQEG